MADFISHTTTSDTAVALKKAQKAVERAFTGVILSSGLVVGALTYFIALLSNVPGLSLEMVAACALVMVMLTTMAGVCFYGYNDAREARLLLRMRQMPER